MTRREFMSRINSVYWAKEAEVVNLTITQMNEKIEYFKSNGSERRTNTNRDEWLEENSYKIDCKGYYLHLFVRENGKLVHYVSHTIDDSKNKYRQENTDNIIGVGRKSVSIESKIFEEKNGVSPRKAFGYCDRELLNICIPKQFYYINENYKNRNLKHVSKVDFSSHYPSNRCGRLPQWLGHKEVQGTVAPTEEYPFAFYVKSGNCAEYGVFDTHNWESHRLFDRLFNMKKHKMITPESDVTILCKASKYTYDETIQELYDMKCRKEEIDGIPAKLVLNSSTGYMHRADVKETRCRLDHVAAISIARANQMMLDVFEKYGPAVLHICVDGMIYMGKNSIGVTEKKLGALIQEFTDCDFRMRGMNQYVFFQDGKCVDCCHSGLATNIKINNIGDIELWQK